MTALPIYRARVHTTTVNFENFNGEQRSKELQFCLDPMSLLNVVLSYQGIDFSGAPANRAERRAQRPGQQQQNEAEQLNLIRDLAVRSAGNVSKDGESWESDPFFDESIAGKAFLTRLGTSDAIRQDFCESVILAPYQAFVEFAEADLSNTPDTIAQLKATLESLRSYFSASVADGETLEQKKARLQAELEAVESSQQ